MTPPPRPQYVRPAHDFGAIFGRAPDLAIASMDEAGDDIPHQAPRHPLAIDSAGLSRDRVPIVVADPLRAGERATLVCSLSISTRVPPEKRGLHISRLNHIVASIAARPFDSLEACALAVAAEVDRTQYGGPTAVKLAGHYHYWEQVPGRGAGPGKLSLEEVELTATAESGGGRNLVASGGLGFDHITACPCVQKTYQHATGRDPGGGPFFTHSQRSRSHVKVSGLSGSLPLAELMRALDRVIHRTQNTLPREHELMLVHRSHSDPQFIEDVVRSLVAATALALRPEHPRGRIEVESRSMESIHGFDIVATASGRIEEFAG